MNGEPPAGPGRFKPSWAVEVGVRDRGVRVAGGGRFDGVGGEAA